MAVKRPEPVQKMGGGRGPGNRPPRGVKGPKIENAGKIFMRLVAYVGKYYWFHWILVAICIVGSVLANLQGTMFTKTLIDDYIRPLFQTARQQPRRRLITKTKITIKYIPPVTRYRRTRALPQTQDTRCYTANTTTDICFQNARTSLWNPLPP